MQGGGVPQPVPGWCGLPLDMLTFGLLFILHPAEPVVACGRVSPPFDTRSAESWTLRRCTLPTLGEILLMPLNLFPLQQVGAELVLDQLEAVYSTVKARRGRLRPAQQMNLAKFLIFQS